MISEPTNIVSAIIKSLLAVALFPKYWIWFGKFFISKLVSKEGISPIPYDVYKGHLIILCNSESVWRRYKLHVFGLYIEYSSCVITKYKLVC